jgi:hypothetical protein
MMTPANPPTPSPRSLRVFLCYAPSDLARVRELYRQLRTAGVQPWFDEEHLLPGQDWQQAIRKAVRETDAVVVCLSPPANICLPLAVPPFDPGAARDFIQQRLRGTNVTFSDAQIAQLIAESGGHPVRLQRAAAELYREYTET